MKLITIIAIDRNSSESNSRTFNVNKSLEKNIIQWESNLPYTKYELMCDELIDDIVIEKILDNLEITY